ncbi:glutaredoxin 2 [Celerinatantimonas sp. YJH-8]|uniref:glutaredoxin 2 n=1 Tax=Celerinatantimonas sp. YJH-8 TaxID=3228714 RepID=UPI0038C3F26F
MKLHIYEHCPFCIKAQMIFGLKGLPVTFHVLLNDDVTTPTEMVGKKMVPILEKDDGKYMPESMDIVHFIDSLDGQPWITQRQNKLLNQWFSDVAEVVHKLVIPRNPQIAFQEFATQAARDYFTVAKTQMIGDFSEHLERSKSYLAVLNPALRQLEPWIESERAVNGELSIDDFQLFSMLRTLSVVKGVEYPAKVEAYRQRMAELTELPLWDEKAL